MRNDTLASQPAQFLRAELADERLNGPPATSPTPRGGYKDKEGLQVSDFYGNAWWSELLTRDTHAAMKYYGAVCGWSFDTMPIEGTYYHIVKKGDKPMVGIVDITGLPGMEKVPAQ